jgi:hypothetical protein
MKRETNAKMLEAMLNDPHKKWNKAQRLAFQGAIDALRQIDELKQLPWELVDFNTKIWKRGNDAEGEVKE